MEVVQSHHVRRLKVALGVLVPFPAATHFIVEFGRGQRGQVGRVRTRDADAVLCKASTSRERKWNEVKKKPGQQWSATIRSCSVGKTARRDMSWLPFRKCCAPSRHSGESSLSPKDPSSSLTMMSAFSGAAQSRMSEDTTVTWSPHSSKRQFSNLWKYESDQMLNWPFTRVHFPLGCIVNMPSFTFQLYQHPPWHDEQHRRRSTHVMTALGFFSTAYTFSFLSADLAARSEALTSGPRPAPRTISTLHDTISKLSRFSLFVSFFFSIVFFFN